MQTSQQTKLRTFIKTKATQVHRHRQVGFSGLFGEGPPTPSKQRYAQLTCFAYTMMRTLFSPTSLSLSLSHSFWLTLSYTCELSKAIQKCWSWTNRKTDRQTGLKATKRFFLSFLYLTNVWLESTAEAGWVHPRIKLVDHILRALGQNVLFVKKKK